MEKFDVVVLSGGATRGVLTLGALNYYYEKGQYDPRHTHTYAGSSIGAVIGLLLICGYTPMEIFTEIYKADDNLFDMTGDLGTMITNMGVMSTNNFIARIETLVKAKMGSEIPTLGELFEDTGKTLVVTASNITKVKCEYYTPKTRPNLLCVDAVKLSCNLPLIFTRIKYDGNYICDGGFMDNFPIKYVDDRIQKILGIVTQGTDLNNTYDDTKFIGYLYRILSMPMHANTELRCEDYRSNTTLIKIQWDNETDSVSLLSLSNEHKLNMFLHGTNTAEYSDRTEYLYVEEWENFKHIPSEKDVRIQ